MLIKVLRTGPLGRLSQLTKSTRTIVTTSYLRGGHDHGHDHDHHAPKKATLFDKFGELMVGPLGHAQIHGYTYREYSSLEDRNNTAIAKLALSIAWAWVFYWLWNAPENITGHFPYPDTQKWTDAELGIPADDDE
jgi:hypothetical protein